MSAPVDGIPSKSKSKATTTGATKARRTKAAAPVRATGAAATPLNGTPIGHQVRVPKTAELVASTLRRQIVRGALPDGNALPPESVLMAQFGVSRPTLREAFRVLESEALISVRRGAHGGARVHPPNPDVAARYAALVLEYQGANLGDLYAASAVIEPPCAAIVAAHHSADDIAQLRAALQAAEAVKADPIALVQAHDDFHALVVRLSANQTLTLVSAMLRRIVDLANMSHVAAQAGTAAGRQAGNVTQRTHARLVALIEAGDAPEAERLWRRHIAAADEQVNASSKSVLDLLG